MPITRRAATHKQPMSTQVLDRAREFRGDHRRVVDALPGEAEAGERLKQTALRDFGPVPEDRERRGRSHKLTLSRDDAPVPSLLEYALILIGLEAYGPEEKVAWWVKFSYRGEWCELAHQKFGLRLYLHTDRPEEQARARCQSDPHRRRAPHLRAA